MNFLKKPSFLLLIILLSFLFKEIFLIAVFPIFSGQDEARHYNTIQFILEPKEKNWKIKKYDDRVKIKEKFETYGFSQEIRETAKIINSNTRSSVPYDYLSFDSEYFGKGEEEINLAKWKPLNEFTPADVANGYIYHNIVSVIEKFFSQENIFVRFFSIRIFSAIMGAFAVLISYFIAKNIGFSKKNSLILAAITSFQPRFSVYFTNINYDVLLIPAFFLFTLGGIFAIKNGINWKNILVMLIAMIIAIFAKMTGIILLPVFFILFVFLMRKKIKETNKKQFIIFLAPVVLIIFLFFYKYDISNITGRYENIKQLKPIEYLTKSLGPGRIMLTSNSYWGNLNWENNFISDNFIKIIWTLESFSLIGLVWFCFSRKKIDFLPDKRYIFFLLFMIITLQLGIRFADFRVFSDTGSLALGAPGRYFIPNLASHMILIFVGFGMLLKRKEYFDKSLLAGLILMASFCFYLIFVIIIPRYYL
jgi:hypothetical protein